MTSACTSIESQIFAGRLEQTKPVASSNTSYANRKCCWSSTLSSGQGPGFEWRGSVHSDWPHSSLSPPSSTGLQRGSGCCSSCSGRLSPRPPGWLKPLRMCWCPPPSSPNSSLRGSPRWPNTPQWHYSVCLPLWMEGGLWGWVSPHPLGEKRLKITEKRHTNVQTSK